MGLTKQYLRYEADGVFNLIGGHQSNIIFLDIKDRKYCAVGACEHVLIWDLRKGEKVATYHGEKHEVTKIAVSPDQKSLAAGYKDGTIRVFSVSSGEVLITYSGHKSAITALNYDQDGMRLVSGAMDTDVIVWDIVNESGLFRLKAHKGAVTQARFIANKSILVTSSKDTFVKLWDLDTQHCFKTIVNHRTEVWDFVITNDGKKLITGSEDMELRVWRLNYREDRIEGMDDLMPAAKRLKTEEVDFDNDDSDSEENDNILTCKKLGSLDRQGKGRVLSMGLDHSGKILCCHGKKDNMIEVFYVNNEEEIKKCLKRKQTKARKKAAKVVAAEEEGNLGEGGISGQQLEQTIADEIRGKGLARLSKNLKSFDIFMESESTAKFVGILVNNSIETITVDLSERKLQVQTSTKLTIPSHRSDVRTLSFSSDNTAILSASNDSVKIWNRSTLQCIRTMSCDPALCSLFAPGDRHVVVGTKSGKLQIFDIAAGALLESIDAHTAEVWSMCIAPDKKSIVTGSADNDVKFWEFELVTDEGSTSKRLTLVHTRTLQMSENVLCVKLSPDNRLIAVSLLDNTVKVFFVDTLKFFHSLYGHNLPVLCMDISTDGTMLVTGSADRNCKLWGLDFGDCHKSIFAHDDSIMCVEFVPKTHMFFTGSKDGKIKQWDGDSFDHIQTLQGHHYEIWCLSISPSGNYVVTGSHDKSLRLWEKTSEPLVLEEEREMEREKEYEASAAQGAEPVIAGEESKEKEVAVAGRKTIETVKAAERIMEALELYKEESAKFKAHKMECEKTGKQLVPPPIHPIFQAFKVTTPERYMLEVMRKVKSSELEESLLVLPFSCVTELLQVLYVFIHSGWEVELSCRCLFFLLRIHQGQITSNHVLMSMIDRLRGSTFSKVTQLRDTLGFNMAAMKYLKQKLEEKESVNFFGDATDAFKQKRKKQKKRALISVKT